MKIIRANERHFADNGWLKTYWLFSFSDYFDPENVQHGALRVFNDDVIDPKSGFPTHPHSEMEIVTIVLSGELTHQDSTGSRGVIRAGEVQRMSAGTGIRHSEFNLSDEPVHLYQIWIHPDERGLRPSYEQKSFVDVPKQNRLLAVASGQGPEGAVRMHTDAAIYVSEIEAGQRIEFEADESRRIFVYVTKGDLGIGEERLWSKDQARLNGSGKLVLEAFDDSSFVLIDAPARE